MPRSGINGVFDWGPGDGSVNPNTTIASARENSVQSDVRQTFNTIWPISLLPVQDGTWYFENTADTTKRVELDLSGITTGNTYTWTVPNKSGTLAMLSDVVTPKGYTYGLALTKAPDAANDVTMAAGEAASDDATPVLITLPSALTKRLDAAWAVGNNQGGRDTGSIANGTWYIWLIRRPDTGVVDWLYSLSNTTPTMPTNYTQKKLVGFVVRASGSNITPYNSGEDPVYESPEQTISVTGTFTLDHGLGAAPNDIQAVLVCKTDQLGYVAGDKIFINDAIQGAASTGHSIKFTATQLSLKYGSSAGPYEIINFSSGTRADITPANWRLVLIAKTTAWM